MSNDQCPEKSEIRISKFETNSKTEIRKMPFGGDFFIRISDLFRISIFGFRVFCLSEIRKTPFGGDFFIRISDLFRISIFEFRIFLLGFVILWTLVIGNSSFGAQPEARKNGAQVATIDLPSALALAGVQSPEILLARERVTEASAMQQLAAAQILPSLNAGLNFDAHTGPLQQASGNILKVNRSTLYVGAGTYAVAAGTVNIPGVVYNLNLSESIFSYLASRQQTAGKRFASAAVQNEGLRQVAQAYINLLRAEGRRSAAYQNRKEAEDVARITRIFAAKGEERRGDAERAANELSRRIIDLTDLEADVQTASDRLAELLNLDPAIRLHPAEEKLVPLPVVPDPLPLPELLAIALLQRPELRERQAVIRQAMLGLQNARLLPFSPSILIGFSGGTFAGGSNLGADAGKPRFGNFGSRNDFDVVAVWTLQNLGVGNWALVNEARSKLRITELERVTVLNRVRAQVADAAIRSRVSFARISATEVAVRSGLVAYGKDFERIRSRAGGLPIELLASLQLLSRARTEYVDAIADFNQAQIDLYVALGEPPANMLARPVPRDFTPKKN
jgi:outer membrane protein TolC